MAGDFDIESNFVIQDPQNVVHMLKLLEACPHTLQVRFYMGIDMTFSFEIIVLIPPKDVFVILSP